MSVVAAGFALAFRLSNRSIWELDAGLITDLLKDSPLKAEQLENIALIEKRMQDEKLAATREVERLKTEFDRALTELHQAQRLAKVLEHEVAEWRHQAKPSGDDTLYPPADAGS